MGGCTCSQAEPLASNDREVTHRVLTRGAERIRVARAEWLGVTSAVPGDVPGSEGLEASRLAGTGSDHCLDGLLDTREDKHDPDPRPQLLGCTSELIDALGG